MATQLQVVEERSLEQIAEVLERKQAREEREDDAEAALDELIMLLADIGVPPAEDAQGMEANEFACSSCHMVMHRSLLGDPDSMMCLECFVPGNFGF